MGSRARPTENCGEIDVQLASNSRSQTTVALRPVYLGDLLSGRSEVDILGIQTPCPKASLASP